MDFGTRQHWPDGTNVENNNTFTNRDSLRDLVPGSTNKVLVGVVIAKLSVHSFPDKKNPGCERYSLGFTFRDSPVDFVNVTCWGNGPFIKDIAKSFKINDIVEIRNPQVSSKQGSDHEQQWKPWTPNNIQLNVSEVHSSISLYSGWDLNELNTLIHTPVTENGEYCAIDDIMSSGRNIHGDHMNILVAVRNIGQPRDITTKRGKQIQKCEVQVFDETCHSFSMTIWDEERIEMAAQWIPGETVLFITDLKIIYDDFKKTMASVCDNRTIITLNPDIQQAHQLYSYAQSPEILNDLTNEKNAEGLGGFNLDSIKDVYSIEKIKQVITKTSGDTSCTPSAYITGIVFGYLTKFNIDDNIENVLVTRCNKCKHKVSNFTGECENPTCNDSSEKQLSYNLLVDISDHSGTLVNCRMMSSALETVLGYSPEQFQQLPTSAVAEFKMKYLLEKCKVYFRISRNSSSNSVLVLSCSLADPKEIPEENRKLQHHPLF